MSTEITTIDYSGTPIYAQGEFVAVRQMTEAMGLKWDTERKRIERSPWSKGWTDVSSAHLPGEDRSREHTFLHRRRVPMWIANIPTTHIKDPSVKATVIRWQDEIADVLADYYEGVSPSVSPVSASRQEIAGTGCTMAEIRELRELGLTDLTPEGLRFNPEQHVVTFEHEYGGEEEAVAAFNAAVDAKYLGLGGAVGSEVARQLQWRFGSPAPYTASAAPPAGASAYKGTPGQDGDGPYASQNG